MERLEEWVGQKDRHLPPVGFIKEFAYTQVLTFRKIDSRCVPNIVVRNADFLTFGDVCERFLDPNGTPDVIARPYDASPVV